MPARSVASWRPSCGTGSEYIIQTGKASILNIRFSNSFFFYFSFFLCFRLSRFWPRWSTFGPAPQHVRYSGTICEQHLGPVHLIVLWRRWPVDWQRLWQWRMHIVLSSCEDLPCPKTWTISVRLRDSEEWAARPQRSASWSFKVEYCFYSIYVGLVHNLLTIIIYLINVGKLMCATICIIKLTTWPRSIFVCSFLRIC